MIQLDRKKFCKYSFDGYCYCPHSSRCNRTCYLFDNDCRHFDYPAVAKRFPKLYAAMKSVDLWTLATLTSATFCIIGFIEAGMGTATVIGACGLILEFFAFFLGFIWYFSRKLYLSFMANRTVIEESFNNGRE